MDIKNGAEVLAQRLYESLKREFDESRFDDRYKTVTDYIKSFGSKGKLPSFTGSLRDIYSQSFEKAFDWACQSTEEIRRYGKAYAEREVRVSTIGSWTFNKRGLVYVERSIDLDLSDVKGRGFSSVGECWSWKKGNGRSYCADLGLMNSNVVTVVLCGYVHPSSIDWVETLYLNLYNMKNETEIRMNDDALVEVSYVRIGGMKVPLNGSYLLNASADKYNKQNWI